MPDADKEFSVSHRDVGQEAAVPAGTLAIGPECRLRLVAAEPEFADLLELAVESLNDSDSFMIRAPQPPDAEPLTLHKRTVERTDPDAEAAVLEKLRKEYGLVPTQSA